MGLWIHTGKDVEFLHLPGDKAYYSPTKAEGCAFVVICDRLERRGRTYMAEVIPLRGIGKSRVGHKRLKPLTSSPDRLNERVDPFPLNRLPDVIDQRKWSPYEGYYSDARKPFIVGGADQSASLEMGCETKVEPPGAGLEF